MKDIWHYARTELAQHILGPFETNLSSALVFFAPRRMGKTEFLIKDMTPLAEQKGWHVFYFSFLDIYGSAHDEFLVSLARFAETSGVISKLIKHISKVSGKALGIKASIDLRDIPSLQACLRDIIAALAKKGKILLLLDEVQILAKDKANATFIASLRTALDVHKDFIKVIFTGSSQEGLRKMFSQSKAPFFHFGQNLPFPNLDHQFTDHLATVFKMVTKRTIDSKKLWAIFEKTQKIPQFCRVLVERLVLNPTLTLETTYKELLNEISDDREFLTTWFQCSALEQLILKSIADDDPALFSEAYRSTIALQLGLKKISASSIQNALRSLQRHELVLRLSEQGRYTIEDPNFKAWLRMRA